MTNPHKSLCVLIIDRSGSMECIRDATILGLNTFIDEQRHIPGLLFGVVTFSDDIQKLALKPVSNVATFNRDNYVPEGGTRLLDALGITIDSMGDYLNAMPEEERPGRISVVVMTDGEENSSRKWARDEIFDMISHQREKYSWQFTFLGANQDAISAGQKMGFGSSSSVDYGADSMSVSSVLRSASHKNTAYLSASAGASVMDWSAEERKDAKAP